MKDEMLPRNIEAEEAVIGSLLIGQGDALVDVSPIISPEDFGTEKLGWAYQAAINLDARGSAIDYLTMCDELERVGKLQEFGGSTEMSRLVGAVPTSMNAEHYADIVYQDSVRRQLIHAASEIVAMAYRGDAEGVEALLAKAEQKLGVVGRRIRPKLYTVSDVLSTFWDELFSPTGKVAQRIFTGLPGIDGPMLGIESGRFWAMAAVPNTGKTAVALNIVRGVARSNGGRVAVLYFHPEQPREEITHLLWCNGTDNVPPIRLKAMMTPIELRQEYVRAAGFVNSSTQARSISAAKVEYLLSDPKPEEIEALSKSQEELGNVQIILDDPSGKNIYQILATIRRVRAKLPNDVFLLVIFDGAHLIPGAGEGNRTQELYTITRNLKIAAQNLVTADSTAPGALIANTQLNREIFQNPTNRIYLMKHLRDSGCLAGDSLVYLPETSERVPIRDLENKSGFSVLAMNADTWKMEPRRAAACFTTGTKPVFRLTTKTGRTIRATANHKFLTVNGWKRLDQLEVGEYISTPRLLPDVGTPSLSDARLALLGHLIGDGCVLPRHAIQYTTNDLGMAELVAGVATEVFCDSVRPRIKKERDWYQVYLPSAYPLTHGRHNPVSGWFRELGIFGLRSHEKRIPQAIFRQSDSAIALFLRHLWSTDGTIKLQAGYPAIHYTSSSPQLASDIQHLLLRLGINATLKAYSQGKKGRDQQRVTVSGHEDIRSFLSLIGVVSESHKQGAAEIAEYLRGRDANTNRDIIPCSVWHTLVLPNMDLTHRQLADALGVAYNGNARYRSNLSREHAAQVARVTGNATLAALAHSDVYWDPVASIEPDGEEPVFDISVEGLHNFVANDITVHNSWEQDADVVIFIDRDSVFTNGNGNGNGAGQWDPFKTIAAKNRQTSQLFTAYYSMHTSTMQVKGRDIT